MPLVNFNDTTPAPVSGGLNVKWQSDGAANMSAYIPASTYVPAASWQTWTPTLSADAGTFTLGSLYLNVYIQQGPVVYFQLRFSATTSTSAAFLFFTLPTSDVTPNNFAAISPAIAETAPAGMNQTELCPSRINNPGKAVIQRTNNAPWPVGSYTFAVSGFYRSA